MRQFKFLRNPIITAHDGGYIFVREFFYTMNKEEIAQVYHCIKIHPPNE